MRSALIVLVLGLVMANGGCVQQMSLAPEVSSVRCTVRTVDPTLLSPVNVRADLAGTGEDHLVSDWAFTDKNGAVTVATHRLGPSFLVCRHRDYEIAYAPVDLEDYGKSVTVSEFTTATTSTIGTTMYPKRPRVVKLAYFEPDSPYTKVESVKVTGTHNRFHMTDDVYVMRDDGLMGDDRASDGVWVTTFEASPGDYGYAFIVNDADRWSRDPHEEATGSHVDLDGFERVHSRITVLADWPTVSTRVPDPPSPPILGGDALP